MLAVVAVTQAGAACPSRPSPTSPAMSNTTTALPVLSPRIPPLVVGKYTFQSRLLVGTGKYPDMVSMQFALTE